MVGWTKEVALTANQRECGALPLPTSKEVYMEEICKFMINNKIYTIYDVDRIEGKKSYVGSSNYDSNEIFIENGNSNQMLLTLKHELMHVWLYENGFKNQIKDKVFDYEELCELVALSNNSINNVVEVYINSKFLDN